MVQPNKKLSPGISNSAFLIFVMAVCFISVAAYLYFYEIPRDRKTIENFIHNSYASDKPRSIVEIIPAPVTRVKLEGSDAIYSFDILKPVLKGQAFMVYQSTHDSLPALSLCDAYLVEKVEMSGGKFSHPMVVNNKRCYAVTADTTKLNLTPISEIKDPTITAYIHEWLFWYKL